MIEKQLDGSFTVFLGASHRIDGVPTEELAQHIFDVAGEAMREYGNECAREVRERSD